MATESTITVPTFNRGRRAKPPTPAPAVVHAAPVQLSDDPRTLSQTTALQRIIAFILNDDPSAKREFKLGGLAGTGKTTLIASLLKHLEPTPIATRGHIHLTSFTGKAVSVLRRKGLSEAVTTHSLLFRPYTSRKPIFDEKTGKPVLNPTTGEPEVVEELKFGVLDPKDSPIGPHSLIIVDEASMQSTALVQGIRSFRPKVLWVGDPGQLEPVGDDPGLMKQLDYELNYIFRQGKDSPILGLAHHVRKGLPLHAAQREYAGQAINFVRSSWGGLSPEQLLEPDQIICGFNKTRIAINTRVRAHKHGLTLSRQKLLLPAEKIICLQNDPKLGVYNGQIFIVDRIVSQDHNSAAKYICHLKDDLENERYLAVQMVDPEQELREKAMQRKGGFRGKPQGRADSKGNYVVCDYAYAITCHKSQGSEWRHVLVVNESQCRMWAPARWLYTAVTRAAERLTVVL